MRNQKHKFLIITWIVASLWGILNVFSATYIDFIVAGLHPMRGAISQFIPLIAAFILIVVLSMNVKVSYKLLYKTIDLLFYFTIICLVIVLLLGDLSTRGGARSVIPFYFFDFQPMEMYKIMVLLFLAKEYSVEDRDNSVTGILKILTVPFIGLFLITIEPDAGGAIICMIPIIFLVFLHGYKLKVFLKWSLIVIVIFLLVIIIPAEFSFFQSYQMDRLTSWIDPFGDPLDTGFHIINSYIAIANGGLSGVGFLNSVQKTGFLYASNTDFIIAIILEEWGIIGALFTMGTISTIVMFLFAIGRTAHERYGMLFCYSFGLLLLWQMFVNIGGAIGLIPLTGVTLPFMSSGLNSLLFLNGGIAFAVLIDKESIRVRKIKKAKQESLFID